MRVFWEQGYEGASLTDLTDAMDITRTSMYAAFGNKDALFRSALQRYTEGPASYGVSACQEPTAREVARAFLAGCVAATTRPDCPAGCLGVQGSLVAGGSGRKARDTLTAWRRRITSLLQERFQRAIEEGDLAAGTDPAQLALYLSTVANGIAVQAASGSTREELQRVAEMALLSWPSPVGHQ